MRQYTLDNTNIRTVYHQWRSLLAASRYDAARQLMADFRRPVYGMLAYMAFYLLSFYFIEQMTRLRYTNIHVALDDVIPFCEWFILPYLTWFGYMIFAMMFLFLFDRDNYHKSATMLYIGMTLFVIVSLFWPNIQYIRPVVMPRDNICTRLVLNLYSTDTPTNLCPSIHVFNTLVAMIGVHRCTRTTLARNRWYRMVMYTIGVLIILSTMFVKQHSVFDVVCAFVCCGVSYFAVYRCGFSLSGKTNTLAAIMKRRKNRLPRRVHG